MIINVIKQLNLMFIKKFVYQSIMLSFIIFINELFIKFINNLYIYTFWGMLCLWVLAESHIIIMDMNYLENKYKDLEIRHKLLNADYLELVKQRHLEFNLICDTLADHTIVIADNRNELIELKNEIRLLKAYRKLNSRNSSKNSSPTYTILSTATSIETSPISNSNINSPPLEIPKISKANSFNTIHRIKDTSDKTLHITMKGRLNEFLGSRSCIF